MQGVLRHCGSVTKLEVFGNFRNLSVRLLALACSVFLCLPSLLTVPASAQTLFGSLVGTVTDAGGAAVADATVKITNLQTNDQRTVQTDGSGVYTVSTIPAGTYGVNVTKAGFHDSATTGVLVNANNTVRVNPTLQVGSVSQTVEVQSGVAAQLQTDTADVRSEIPC